VQGQARQQGVRAVRASTEEFEDGRVRQDGLTRKLPSPALKECSGSYNPSILNTFTRGTIRYGSVQGHRDKQRLPGFVSLCRPERDTHRVKKGVFETSTRDGRGVFGQD
jgi:hypothetical protein